MGDAPLMSKALLTVDDSVPSYLAANNQSRGCECRRPRVMRYVTMPLTIGPSYAGPENGKCSKTFEDYLFKSLI